MKAHSLDAPHSTACVCVTCKSRPMRVGRMVRLIGSSFHPDALVPVIGVERDPKSGWVLSVLVTVDGREARFRLEDVEMIP